VGRSGAEGRGAGAALSLDTIARTIPTTAEVRMRSALSIRGRRGALMIGLLALAHPSRDADAAFLCATTADELRDALAQVSDGGAYVDEDSVIAIGPGTFATGGTPFRSEALTTTAKLDIMASWNPHCGGRPSGPPTTVLDAGGVGGVLVIKRPHAFVYLRRMVLQNGNADVGAGLQVNHGTESAYEVSLYQLIVRNNHASGNGGGIYIAASAPPDMGAIGIASSLIVDNTSGSDGGGAYLVISGGYTSIVNLTTVASNTAVGTGGGIAATGSAATYDVSGVIVWGNTPASLRFDVPSTVASSDVDLIAPGAAVTTEEVVQLDPMFLDPAAGDYRFGNVPGLVGTGAPFNYVPAYLDDYPLPPTGGEYRADMGAYTDVIFRYGDDGGSRL
jgi:hypothetical protein